MKIQRIYDDVSDNIKDVGVYEVQGQTVLSFPHAGHGWPRYAIETKEQIEIVKGAWEGNDLTSCRVFVSCDVSMRPTKKQQIVVLNTETLKFGAAI